MSFYETRFLGKLADELIHIVSANKNVVKIQGNHFSAFFFAFQVSWQSSCQQFFLYGEGYVLGQKSGG